jgi:hypothetical protein
MKQQIPVGVIIAAAVALLAVIGFFAYQGVKNADDTQGGVVYGGSPEGYKKRMQEKMGASAGAGYGQRPGGPVGVQQGQQGYGGRPSGYGQSGYGQRPSGQ